MAMSEGLISRNEAAALSGTSATIVNKAIEQNVVHTLKLGARSLIDARDVGALCLFAEMPVTLPVRLKQHVAAWARDAELGAELALSDVLIVRVTIRMSEAVQRARRYVELRERFLEVNPEVQGGEPVIRGTRVPVRGLAKQIQAGEDPEVLAAEYDYIDPDAFEFAVLWATANPRRGRPLLPSGTSEKPEPARRAELITERRRRAPASN
jgi:uncharacterized protein (DUF433 family)